MKAKKIIAFLVACLLFFSLYAYKARYVLKYKADSYTITNIEEDILVWTHYDFDILDDDRADIIKNPSKYYLVVFEGEMFNSHFYSLYNWYSAEKEPLSVTSDYWIDASHSEGTYAFEPFSTHSHNVYILVRCDKNEIEEFCENILLNQLLFCKGEIIIDKFPLV